MKPLDIFLLFVFTNAIFGAVDKRWDTWYHVSKWATEKKIFRDHETGYKTFLILAGFLGLWSFVCGQYLVLDKSPITKI
jgi:hypothetical protein